MQRMLIYFKMQEIEFEKIMPHWENAQEVRAAVVMVVLVVNNEQTHIRDRIMDR
jgi:hypothetical protein